MLQLVKKFFTWGKDNKKAPMLMEQEDLPRYPPFATGLPAADAARIFDTQSELISRIQGILRFTADDFTEIVTPVIENYAAYVHLLPASEAHHHRGAGGLFRHGLEVGFWAAQQAEAHQFCIDETPSNKRNNEPRWQFAAFLGGLLHDVGKPLSDVAVTNKDGSKEWNPYESSLSAWTVSENVDHYFLRWRDKRNKRHEKFSMMNLDQIITQKAKTYLNKPGPSVMEALLESIVGISAQETLTQLVMWADQESVRRDLVNQRMNVDEYSYGVPVERFIFDALRQLVILTKVNEPGALVWRSEHGVFFVWKKITAEIHNLIEKDKIPGIPRNHDTLADILVERGFAVPYQETAESKPTCYWNIYPECLSGIRLTCLRIDDIELIYPGEPPPPTKILFNKPEKNVEKEQSNIIAPVRDKSEQATQSILHKNNLNENQIMRHEQIASIKTNAENKIKKDTTEDKAAVTIDNVPEQKQPVHENKNKALNEQKDDDNNNEPREGDGWIIINKAIKVTINEIKSPALIKLKNDCYGIPYPESARQLGEPRDVMNTLSDNRLLCISQIAATKTTTIDGKKFLVLQSSTTSYINGKLSNVESDNTLKEKLRNNKIKDSVKKEKTKFDVNKFVTEFINQFIAGFGEYIDGDVLTTSENGKITYVINKEPTIKKVMNKHGLATEKSITIPLVKAGFTINRHKIIFIQADREN